MSTPSTTPRPYVLLSAAVSLDGYLDDNAPDRLLLSGAEDLDRVDEVRAGADAILIGARTMRRDNPRLLVNSPDRQAARVARGLPAQPLRVTVTGSGDLDPGLRFWHHGGDRLVFTVDAVAQRVPLDLPLDLPTDLPPDLPPGTAVPPGRATDRFWMRRAIELSRRCPPSATAYSVGAVLVAQDGTELASGYSRETDPRAHAEEAALAKLGPDPRLARATLYCTLGPCSRRSADRTPCSRLVIGAGVRRVVIAWRDPPLFVDCDGVEPLTSAGIAVEELPDLAGPARAVNARLIGGAGC